MTTKDEAIRAAFVAFGSNEIQTADALLVLGSRVIERGGEFFYNDASSHDVPISNFSAFKKTMAAEKPHLLPPQFESSLADRAFIDGNLSARAQLIREVGELEAARVAKSYGLTGIGDTKRARAAQTDEIKRGGANNPWSDSPQNVDRNGRYTATAIGRQAALVRANEKGAAEIAAVCGNKIGDTKPARRSAYA
jgi:hypothetical protein